jgi:hypothetical protein
LFIGLAASGLNIIAQTIVLIRVYEVNRWLVLLGVGLLLVAAAIFLEQRQGRLSKRVQVWRELLEAWD